MNEGTTENKTIDPMIEAFFDGSQQENLGGEEQQKEAEEAQRLADEQAKNEEEERLAKENEEKEKERLAQEEEDNKKAEAEKDTEKLKRWDEGLDDQAKFILDKLSKGEHKDVYDLLKNKFGYENLTDEQKALTFLQEKHPHLDHEDLLFKAAQEYGIGATEVNEDDLTADQKDELRKQSIERKGLLSEADKYFKDKSVNLNIPALPNPLDEDEGYKEYLSYKGQQEELKAKQAEEALVLENDIKETNERVNKVANELDVLPIELNIDLDQGEFAFKSEFKLDDAKKKQLAEYAMDYTPTQAEVKAHQNQSGEFDMKGYMVALANKLFSVQIQKAAIKQAISKDRDEFTERELKNSTLRNNSNMNGNADQPFDLYTEAMGK